jgi:hypothetical protein
MKYYRIYLERFPFYFNIGVGVPIQSSHGVGEGTVVHEASGQSCAKKQINTPKLVR